MAQLKVLLVLSAVLLGVCAARDEAKVFGWGENSKPATDNRVVLTEPITNSNVEFRITGRNGAPLFRPSPSPAPLQAGPTEQEMRLLAQISAGMGILIGSMLVGWGVQHFSSTLFIVGMMIGSHLCEAYVTPHIDDHLAAMIVVFVVGFASGIMVSSAPNFGKFIFVVGGGALVGYLVRLYYPVYVHQDATKPELYSFVALFVLFSCFLAFRFLRLWVIFTTVVAGSYFIATGILFFSASKIDLKKIQLSPPVQFQGTLTDTDWVVIVIIVCLAVMGLVYQYSAKVNPDGTPVITKRDREEEQRSNDITRLLANPYTPLYPNPTAPPASSSVMLHPSTFDDADKLTQHQHPSVWQRVSRRWRDLTQRTDEHEYVAIPEENPHTHQDPSNTKQPA